METMGLRKHLDLVLSENPHEAEQRARRSFCRECDGLSAPIKLVLYGAGNVGKKALAALLGSELEVLAFVDKRSELWGASICGIPVLDAPTAVSLYGGSALFVVTVCSPSIDSGVLRISAELRALGARKVIPFVTLFWAFPDTLLPHYMWDLPTGLLRQFEGIRRAFSLLGDMRSAETFVRYLEFLSFGDFDLCPEPCSDVQYFPDFLIPHPDGEAFVDAGAYTGDSIDSLFAFTGERVRHLWAFEPDPSSFSTLEKTVSAQHSLRGVASLYPYALGAKVGEVRFRTGNESGSLVAESGEHRVQCTTVDSVLEGQSPTFIKMDIEGAELEALAGAASLIRRCQPVCAIASYHRQDHFWRVPILLRELLPSAQVFVRSHSFDGFELVTYKVDPIVKTIFCPQ